MITPTIGRIIYVRNRWASGVQKNPEPAIIVHVHSDRLINVAGWASDGGSFIAHALPLIQDGEEAPSYTYAEWMPYQKSVAKGEIPPVLHAEPK